MKIPDDVFTTRCRYCGHGQTGAENKEIPDDKLFIHFVIRSKASVWTSSLTRCLEFANTALSQTVFIPDFVQHPAGR